MAKIPYNKSKRAKKTKKSMKIKSNVKMVKSIVKQEIHRQEENKMRQNGGTGSILPTTHTNYQTNCIIPLSPYYEAGLSVAQNLDIAQGTSIASRIGNRINTRSGRLRFVLYPSAYNATTNPNPQPCNVTMWIFKLKSGLTDSSSNVLGTLQNNWFKYGSSSIGIQNNLGDNVLIPNPDFIQVLKRKIFKVGCAVDNGTGGSATLQYFANNDYKYNNIYSIDCTKYIRKNIHYPDNSLIPSTATTWCAFTVSYATNTTMTNSTIPVQFQWEYDFRYEDA